MHITIVLNGATNHIRISLATINAHRMKTRLVILVGLIIMSYSCSENKVLFEIAQPANTKSINSFHKDYFGQYKYDTQLGFFISLDEEMSITSNDFSSTFGDNFVQVNSDNIIAIVNGDENFLKEMLDSGIIETTSSKFLIDSLFKEIFVNPLINYEYDIINKDTLITKFSIQDTIFNLNSELYKLKKFKNILYLNVLDSSNGYWSVYQMYQSKNKLFINSLSGSDEVVLERIMIVNKEMIGKDALNPSKKTFKKLLKLDGFTNKNKFEKTN